MTAASQLRRLTLNMGDNGESTLYRLEKGWTLHFVLGPSLAAKKVRVFTNHPADSKAGPNRHIYHELVWQNMTGLVSDVYDNFAEVGLVIAGSFNYFFTIDGSDKAENANGSGFFLVDPILSAGKMDDRVPLDSIRCQTYLAKSLGPFPEWKSRLQVSKEAGYNMIHFTPLQELGLSNSGYCLKNQLKLNPFFSEGTGKTYTFDDVEALVKMMRDEWNVLSLTDLVFNHTANESPWLLEHPECSYNMVNSPHLKPAYVLDRIMWHFSLEVGEGKWAGHGVPAELRTDGHMQQIKHVLLDIVLPKYAIQEFYQVHIDETIQAFRNAIIGGVHGDDRIGNHVEIVNDPRFRRLKSTIDIPLAIKLLYSNQSASSNKDLRINYAIEELRRILMQLNDQMAATIRGHLECAVNNYTANGRWRFVDENGDRFSRVTPTQPIMWNYFTLPKEEMSVEHEEEVAHTADGAFAMAHNGWVMGDDPLRNFAEPGSNIYLRRELIPWGDNVKLRYGQSPKDCPFLWDYMRKYVTESARIFHGVRLDNCHSTPIKLAEYMLDEARVVRPDLYVIAELFTSSEYMDNVFINRLGLNSLIREGLNANSARDLGRSIHRFGGFPVGSFMQPPERPLVPSMAHALFYDQTHDNESPIQKRSVYDSLPSAALLAMGVFAIGSNRGFDEFVPHYINVVNEKRLYPVWSDDKTSSNHGITTFDTGIIAAKRAINDLHNQLTINGFEQVFVDSLTDDVVSVTRHNPVNHCSVILVARTAFSNPHNPHNGSGQPAIRTTGILEEVIFEAKLNHVGNQGEYKPDDKFINGLPNFKVSLREHLQPVLCDAIGVVESGNNDLQINLYNLPPGSVIAFRISPSPMVKNALLGVRKIMTQFGYRMRTFSYRRMSVISDSNLEEIMMSLSLNDMNRLLFRCDSEEKDDLAGFGAYHLDNYGPIKYCGLQGLLSILDRIRAGNDLGHPLCENIRRGDWLMDYTANRLLAHPGTLKVGKWFENAFRDLKKAPFYLKPCYFDAIVTGAYNLAEMAACQKMSDFVRDGSSFIRMLAQTSLQMCSFLRTSPLPPLSSNLAPPTPQGLILNDGTFLLQTISMAAGIPHFASGLFRSWGRDTFISLRGLLLVTARYNDARILILAYGGCLRHGLIPNLLGSGAGARYNCRDAVWFWLQCIKDYCMMAPNGIKILNDKVCRLYPDDNASMTTNVDQPLHQVMQEALQRHAEGLSFRERNAGPNIDSQMCDNGFNNRIGVDWKTGFVFGGNENNCGTWMDKMGSSEKAKNKGVPATPRDGSAVELIGLCASVTRWLGELHSKQLYPHEGVTVTKSNFDKISFKDWAALIAKNFEAHFYIEPDTTKSTDPRPDLINRRGIYKDTLGAKNVWTDYQLRCNFPIALAVAPEICNPEHMWNALELAGDVLLGPLGMKTLDPSDYNYNGYYFTDEDSDDYKRAKGFNYHNGPEWVWPVGYFMRAKLQAASLLEKTRPGILEKTQTFIKYKLAQHNQHLFYGEWKGLPELTNENGNHCASSCESQAWSASCLLDALYDMEELSNDDN